MVTAPAILLVIEGFLIVAGAALVGAHFLVPQQTRTKLNCIYKRSLRYH